MSHSVLWIAPVLMASVTGALGCVGDIGSLPDNGTNSNLTGSDASAPVPMRSGSATSGSSGVSTAPGGSGGGGTSPSNSGTVGGASYDAGSAPPLGAVVADASAVGPLPEAGGGTLHSATVLSVVGNQLMSGGKPVRLIGVNYPGTEYMCLGGSSNGMFQGPSDQSLVAALKGQKGQAAWRINTVRVPLNEDCWLGINGVPAQQSGTAYQNAVMTFVKMLRQSGFYVILDLHWNAPGNYLSDAQQPMADADHAPTFWKSVATVVNAMTNRDNGILFDLYNEPAIYPPNATVTGTYPDDQSWWNCWQKGGCQVTVSNGVTGGQPNSSCPIYPNPLPPPSKSWQVAGMQSLVDAVRGAGATNVILLGGLGVANILDHWLEHMPTDSLSPPQIAASLHQYNVAVGTTASYWDTTVAPIAAKVPVVTGELGEMDNAVSFINGFMGWADQHGVSYVAWAFNPYGSPALVTGFDGTATTFGAGYRSHIASVAVALAPAPL